MSKHKENHPSLNMAKNMAGAKNIFIKNIFLLIFIYFDYIKQIRIFFQVCRSTAESHQQSRSGTRQCYIPCFKFLEHVTVPENGCIVEKDGFAGCCMLNE